MRADSAAAIAAESGEDMYIGFPLLMKCRTVTPVDYDTDKTYPLVIGLHGAGDTPERFGRLCEYFDAHDFIYAAPQAPYRSGRQGGGFLWFGAISAEDEAAAAEARTLNSAYILHLIDRLKHGAQHRAGVPGGLQPGGGDGLSDRPESSRGDRRHRRVRRLAR